MSNFQRLFAALVLTLAFSIGVIAGDMQTGSGIAQPPTPAPASPTTQGSSASLDGQIHTGPGATTEGESLSEVVWGVFEGVLALF